MQQPIADARLADLAYLDVLDVRLDGSYALNAEFYAAALQAHAADPSRFGSIFGDLILARAMARGVALMDVEELALAALEVAVDAEEARA